MKTVLWGGGDACLCLLKAWGEKSWGERSWGVGADLW